MNKNDSVKVLYFVDRMLRGGIQSLIMDWVSRFDRNKVQIDFLLLDDGKHYELEEQLTKMGCQVYKLKGVWINTPFDYIKYRKKLIQFYKNHHDYHALHLHSSSKNYMVMKYARKYGIPIRIAHAHNIDFQTKNKLKKIVGNCLKKPLIKYSNHYFACSKVAGEWLFGETIVDSKQFRVIHNTVNYDKFKFNSVVRKEIRKEFGICIDDILIGHVGRFSIQKNHTFLIDIFYELRQLNNHYKLILVGIGELQDVIRRKVKELQLEDAVIFCNFRNDVYRIMQAMDVFLLPSLHEGLPVVGVEAQAAGLPIFTSKDVVTNELKIANNVYFISLNEDAKMWAYKIHQADKSRRNNYKVMKEKKYFVDDVVDELEEVYTVCRED